VARRRNLQAFEHAYRAEGPYVAAVLGRLSVPDEAVRDAVQDVFVAAYRRWHDFDPSRPVRPWLTGFARHVAFRYRRSAARRARKSAALSTLSRDGAPPPNRQVDARDFLSRFLRELPPGYQQAYILTELEGYAAHEVAQILGISTEAVYGRIRSTRRRLKQALLDDGQKPARTAAAFLPPWQIIVDHLAPVARRGVFGTGWIWGSIPICASLVFGTVGALATVRLRDPDDSASIAARLPKLDTGTYTDAKEPLEPRPEQKDERIARAGVPRPAHPIDLEEHHVQESLDEKPLDEKPLDEKPLDDGLPSDTLAREASLLRAARQLLDDGEPEAALARLHEHAKDYPNGQLADARRRNRIRALCELGQPTEARNEARRLSAENPDNALARQALSICSFDRTSDPNRPSSGQ